MLFKVEMTVSLPASMTRAEASDIKQREREYSHRLQREGKCRHLWRIAGSQANISIFDVRDAEELHELLTALPLFSYMQINVQALCRHPYSVYDDDR